MPAPEINPPDRPKLPVIPVWGQRPDPGVRSVDPPFGTFFGPAATGGAIFGAGFLAPALEPVIEEVVVTAKRAKSIARPAFAPKPSPFGATGPGLMAVVAGWLTSQILRDLSEAHLERSYAELEAIRGRVKPDSPLEVKPQTQVEPRFPARPMEEIIATASRSRTMAQIVGNIIRFPVRRFNPRRRDPRRGRPVRPSRPPGRPRRPRRAPRPQTPRPTRPTRVPRIPEWPSSPPATVPSSPPATVPATQPATIPQSTPATIPSFWAGSQIQFATAPGAFPGAVPGAAPGAAASPSFFVGGVQSLTGVGSIVLSSLSANVAAQPQVDAAQRRCKPCKEDKEEQRSRCYKKLVFERSYPQWDESFDWAEIDCETGREL